MTAKHDDALLALLRSDPEFTDTVYDGQLQDAAGNRIPVEQGPERYVVLHSNRGVFVPERFTGYAIARRKTWWLHSVGLTKRQSEGVAERMLALAVNARLAVTGWRCDPIQHPASQPPSVDLTVKPARYLSIDQLSMFTSPTA